MSDAAQPDNEEQGGVGEAALIATFYGNRGQAELTSLNLQFDRFFNRWEGAAREEWETVEGDVFGRIFNPAGASEASVVQIAANATEPGAAGCMQARQRLIEAIGPVSLDDLWGYSLVYEALIAADADAERGLRDLLGAGAIRGLDARIAPEQLAAAEWAGGHLWLTAIPKAGEGLAAATIYVALSVEPVERDFLMRVVYGVHPELLLPDLLAHEGYFMTRQVQSLCQGLPGQLSWDQRVDALQAAATELRGARPVDEEQLDRLGDTYDSLGRDLTEISRQRTALSRLRHNYGVRERRLPPNEILEFHRGHIEAAIVDANLTIEDTRDRLQSAQGTMNIIRAETDRMTARRQQSAQFWLAMLAVLIVVPQLIDADVARQILEVAHLPVPEIGSSYALKMLSVRVGLMVLILGIIWLGMKMWSRWRRRGGDR